MSKRHYFCNKIPNIAKRWGIRPQTTLPPTVGGKAPEDPYFYLIARKNLKTSVKSQL